MSFLTQRAFLLLALLGLTPLLHAGETVELDQAFYDFDKLTMFSEDRVQEYKKKLFEEETWRAYQKYGLVGCSTALLVGTLYYWKYGFSLPSLTARVKETNSFKPTSQWVYDYVVATPTATPSTQVAPAIFPQLPTAESVSSLPANYNNNYLRRVPRALGNALLSGASSSLSNIWSGMQTAGRWMSFSTGLAIAGLPLSILGYSAENKKENYLRDTFGSHDFSWFMQNQSLLSTYSDQLYYYTSRYDQDGPEMADVNGASIITAYNLVIQEVEKLLAVMDMIAERLPAEKSDYIDRASQISLLIERATRKFSAAFQECFHELLIEKKTVGYRLSMLVAGFVENVGAEIKNFLPVSQ
jgi:hypothetical protein